MTITIDDIDVLIRHHLHTGFFMLGELVGMEVEGLAMGSPMGSALTRMALIFCDLTFYYSLHGPELPPLGYRGRVYETVVLGHALWLLEVRYMDDYILLWKGPSYLKARDLMLLSSCLARRAGERYPLPLERDDSLKFVGVDLRLSVDGGVAACPSTGHLGDKDGAFEFEGFSPYYSFVPDSTKRSIVLGIVARVAQFTFPDSLRFEALRAFRDHLTGVSGYPVAVFDSWASEGTRHWAPQV